MHAAKDSTSGEYGPSPARLKRVLCYGHDAVLLHSRRRILEQAGCPSAVANTDAEFRAYLAEECPGVIVFCQTILLDEGLRATAFAQEHCPGVPLLLMYIQRQRLCPVQEHHYLQANQGPREFARIVFHMLYDDGAGREGGSFTPR